MGGFCRPEVRRVHRLGQVEAEIPPGLGFPADVPKRLVPAAARSIHDVP